MKKVFSQKYLIILFLAIVLIIPFVISLEHGADGGRIAGAAVASFFTQIFNSIFEGRQLIGSKFLLGILLFLVIHAVMPMLWGHKKFINFFVSVIITILALIAIPDGLLKAVVAHYGVLGATILSLIPFFIIVMLSVMVRNALIARVIWLFYAGYYFTFYIYLTLQNYNANGGWVWVGTADSASGSTFPYLAAFIVGLFLFFAIGGIRDILFKGKMDALRESGEQIAKRGGLLHHLQKEELEKSYDFSKGIS